MKQHTNQKPRPRGRSNNNNNNNYQRKGPGPSRNQSYDSNGPGVRIRGSAHQIMEKYLTMGRDAASQGERVLSENCFQHAEHYFRIIQSMPQPQPRPAPQPASDEASAPQSANTADGQVQPEQAVAVSAVAAPTEEDAPKRHEPAEGRRDDRRRAPADSDAPRRTPRAPADPDAPRRAPRAPVDPDAPRRTPRPRRAPRKTEDPALETSGADVPVDVAPKAAPAETVKPVIEVVDNSNTPPDKKETLVN